MSNYNYDKLPRNKEDPLYANLLDALIHKHGSEFVKKFQIEPETQDNFGRQCPHCPWRELKLHRQNENDKVMNGHLFWIHGDLSTLRDETERLLYVTQLNRVLDRQEEPYSKLLEARKKGVF